MNRYLERLAAQHVDSLAVFVMDRRGRVVASSDWILTDNLLGADLSRRPYFKAAIKGAPYRQYAVDGVRDRPASSSRSRSGMSGRTGRSLASP